MNAWLIAKLGMTFSQFGTLLGFLGSVALNIMQYKDRLAARTIALNNATIKSLETSLAA